MTSEAEFSCGGRVMKSFMLIAVVIMLSSVVAADPVHIQFTGYVEDNYLAAAGSEYFGVLPKIRSLRFCHNQRSVQDVCRQVQQGNMGQSRF